MMDNKDQKTKKYFKIALFVVVVLLIWRLINITFVSMDQILGVFATIHAALSPVYIGLIIAYLLNPIMERLDAHIFRPLLGKIFKRKKHLVDGMSRGLSVLFAVIAGFFIIFGVFMLLIPELIDSLTLLANNLPTYYRELLKWVNKLSANNPEMANYLTEVTRKAYVQLQNWLENQLLPSSTEILAVVSGSVKSFLGSVVDVFIGIIFAVYLLGSKETFIAQARKLIYAIFKRSHADAVMRLSKESNELFSKFISGKIIDSIIVGIITFIVMWLLNMPYVSLISVIIGVTNIIPFFGQYIGIIPSAFLILLVRPVKCLIFLIAIAIIMQVDANIIGPRILGGSIGLGSFWILFSIIVFGSLFGIVGMLVAVPVFALVYRNVKRWSVARLKKKQLPIDTEYYEESPIDRQKKRR